MMRASDPNRNMQPNPGSGLPWHQKLHYWTPRCVSGSCTDVGTCVECGRTGIGENSKCASCYWPKAWTDIGTTDDGGTVKTGPTANELLGKAERKAKGEMAPREDALQEAIKLITGDRNNQYGPPTQDFLRTADILNGMGYRLNGAFLKGSDIALIMSALKLSRLVWQRGKRDSWVDLAGYAGCGFENAEEEK